MKVFVSLCLLVFVSACVGLTQDTTINTGEEGRIVALESAWNHAEQTKDEAAIAQLLGEKLVYIDYDGTKMNKLQFLVNVKRADYTSSQIINEGVNVYMYSNAAVATGTYREKGIEKGKPFVRHGRFTDTWIKDNGTWQCVASQSTLISH